MTPFALLPAGCRRAALPLGLGAALWLAAASAVQAQRLLTLVPGVGAASLADDPGPSIGPPSTVVQVDLELLRGAPARLEVPTPDGSVLSAERSVFEDRGAGDLMWSGGQPDAGYDTVVLTVEGGRLVGRFGSAGGGAYRIHAEPDGRGGMAPVMGPRRESWCGVEAVAEGGQGIHAHSRAGTLAADPPLRVSNPQSHDRLDILVAYTATAAENWARIGGARAAIRQAGDYLKMVFRNNGIPVEPHIVHIARASAGLDRVGRDSFRHEHLWGASPGGFLLDSMDRDGELTHLRHEHEADLVHLFTGEGPGLLGACGMHRLLYRGADERFANHAFGWTSNACGQTSASIVFAHEVGHGLGAHHEPINARRGEPFKPYSYGYANFDILPSLGTAMSYQGQVEPFFSTPRIRPWRARAGLAGKQDNERTLRETVHIGARFSDNLAEYVEGRPKPVGDLRGRMERGGEVLGPTRATGRYRATVHLSWRPVPGADGYVVSYFDDDNDRATRLRFDGPAATIQLEQYVEPGDWKAFYVSTRKDGVTSLVDSWIRLVMPGEPIPAPSDVSATVDRWGSVEVNWTDNSDGEATFDVQLLRNGEPIERERQERGLTVASLSLREGERQVGAEYGVRVFAFDSSGSSEGSDVVTFRWEHPEWVGPVTGLAVEATGPTSVRLTWTPVAGVERYRVETRLSNWLREDVASGRLWPGGPSYVDLDALPRGGRFEFAVLPLADAWMPARTHLTLGERAVGPRGPSGLSSSPSEGGARLTWRDNSNDELGFVIVQSHTGEGTTNAGPTLEHLFCVPPDTESVVVYPSWPNETFRVFAYNERGYSAESRAVQPGSSTTSLGTVSGSAATAMSCVSQQPPPDPEPPPDPPGPCEADDETLCLRDSRFKVSAEWWTVGGESGSGKVVHVGANDSGLFHFFDPTNWEILIKVLDGCGTNGRVWVLGASTTDLGYSIRVTDTVTGGSRSYRNEPGQAAPAFIDTNAFSKPCEGGVSGR